MTIQEVIEQLQCEEDKALLRRALAATGQLDQTRRTRMRAFVYCADYFGAWNYRQWRLRGRTGSW